MASKKKNIPSDSSINDSRQRALSSKSFLACLIALYFVFAAAYNHLIPYRSGAHAAYLINSNNLPVNPDEAAHVANAVVYKSGHIPVFRANSGGLFEAHQPPFYYVLITPGIDPTSDRPADGARWISIFMGALLIVAVFQAVLTIFPEHVEITQGTAIFAALIPMNVNLCASISNDVLTNLVVAVGIWQTSRIVKSLAVSTDKSLTLESSVLGLILAVGIYSKTSTLVLFALIGFAAGAAVVYKLTSIKRAFLLVAVSYVVGIVLAIPWLERNTLLYGDPFAQHIFQSAFLGSTETAAAMTKLRGGAGEYWLLVAKLTFESFWGAFDGMRLFLMPWIYGLIGLVVVVSFAGLTQAKYWLKLTKEQKVMFSGLIGLTLMTVAGYLRFNMTFFQAQGRYLYPTLIPIGMLFTIGLCSLKAYNKNAKNPEPNGRPIPVILMIGAGLAILNVYCILWINTIFPPVQ